MIRITLISIITLLCSMMSLHSHAQQYPVQANVILSGPAPSTISGFVPGSSSRVTASLLLNDVSTPNLNVKLRFIFEGPGITIQTSPNAIVPEINLQGGVPKNLTTQLEPYFQPNAFQLTSGSWGSFMPNGRLPEGNYIIKMQVIEPRRNVVISNTAITMAWVMLNDPPVIVMPSDGAEIDAGGVQNIMFTWMPQNAVVPMGGQQLQYTFELWEAQAGDDPNVVAGSLPSTYSYQMPMTSLVWGPAYPLLNPGQHYVCRVTASDPSNQVMFKNQGQSVPIMFQYGSTCYAPVNPSHSDIDHSSAKISWVAMSGTENFKVEFMPTDSDVDEEWRVADTTGSHITISALSPSTSYTYRVKAVCGGIESSPTPSRTFTTAEIEPLNNECNLELEPPEIDDNLLREDLEPLDMILAGSFPFVIDEISNQNDTKYTGRGRITLPLFDVAIYANFEEMEVTIYNQMASGSVIAMRGDTLIFTNDDPPPGPGPGGGYGDYPPPDDSVHINQPIDSLDNVNDTVWVVYSGGGTIDTVLVPADGSTYISDGDGTSVVVYEDDIFNVEDDGGGGGENYDPVTEMAYCERQLEFVPHNLSKYGIDTYKDPPVTGYQSITLGTNIVPLGWKAMSTGEQGKLKVNVNDNHTDPLIFQYQSGGDAVSFSGDNENGYSVNLGTPPNNSGTLLAICGAPDGESPANVAGGIGVAAYDPLSIKLKVVPVETSSLSFTKDQLEQALNDIYNPAVTFWEVEYQEPLTFNNWDDDGDGLIKRPATDYSTEMRAVWESYLGSMQYETPRSGEVFIFVIPGITEGGDVHGYMPLKSRYGFVTADASTRTVAHELGHGVFNLRHTFSEENSFTLPQGDTDNLMDYSDGTELWKYQWDFIHNPEGGWHIFEDVEEGEIIEDAIDEISGVDYAYIKLCNTTISGDENQTTTTEVYKFIGKNENGYVVGEITVPDFTGAYPVINEQDHTEAILIFSNGSIISICEPQHDYSNFCELEDPLSDNTLISNFEDDVNNCRQAKAIDLLSQLNQLARSTQKFELEIGGKVYELQGDNLVEITTSIEDINQGNWSDASVETRMRVGLSDGGIYQYSAFGIHKDIIVATIDSLEKIADIPLIAANMRNKANACFEYYEVKDIASTLDGSNGSLDSGEFPGGGNLEISKNVSFFKIICEAGGVGVEFLKTGLIEQPVYFEDQDYVIKAPGILTGTLEGAAIAVTDITSIVSAIFDIVTDSEARSQAVNGFISIKNQIVENPSIAFSLLFEIALEEVTGSDSQGFKDMVASNTNGGRKKHLISKTSIRTASSVFLGGAFLAKLSDFALEVATKLPKAKLWARFRSLDGSLTDDLLAKLDDLPDGGNNFLNDFANASDEALEAFLENPDLVESWKLLDNAGVDATLRKNPTWLGRAKRWTDEGLEIASDGRILKEGSEIGRIVGDRLHVKYTGYGDDIVCDPNKTTTIIGKWQDNVNGGGTSEIINSKLSVSGQNNGGVNALSFDGSGMTESQQWAVNRQWIDDAVTRGDPIRVISDPTDAINIYKGGDPANGLSFFGKEVDRLVNVHGYSWDQNIFQYVK